MTVTSRLCRQRHQIDIRYLLSFLKSKWACNVPCYEHEAMRRQCSFCCNKTHIWHKCLLPVNWCSPYRIHFNCADAEPQTYDFWFSRWTLDVNRLLTDISLLTYLFNWMLIYLLIRALYILIYLLCCLLTYLLSNLLLKASNILI